MPFTVDGVDRPARHRDVCATAHYSGRQNLDLYLAKLTAAYPQPSRVTLAGTSAGGFGALINFGHVHEVFGKTRVDLISDSAPALWMKAPIWSGLGSWNFGPALPAGCPDCARDLRGLYAYYSKTYPDSRLAVSSFDADFAMGTGGYALLTPWQFTDALRKLADDTLGPLPNFKAFFPSGNTHGMLYDLDTVAQPRQCVWFLGICVNQQNAGEPATLGQWLTRMETDDPSWDTTSGIAR